MKTTTKIAFIILFLILIQMLLASHIYNTSMRLSHIENVYDPEAIYSSPNNNSLFIFATNKNNNDYSFLRSEVEPLLRDNMSDLTKAIVVRKWIREQVSLGKGRNFCSPVNVLKLWQNNENKGMCGQTSLVYVATLNSIDIPAREIALMPYYYNTRFAPDGKGGHAVVEFWSSELDKWVFMDPMYNGYYSINGSPASTYEIHIAHKTGTSIEFIRNGSDSEPSEYPYNLFGQILYRKNNNFVEQCPSNSFISWLAVKIPYVEKVQNMYRALANQDTYHNLVTQYNEPFPDRFYFKNYIFLIVNPLLILVLILFLEVIAIRNNFK